MQPESTDLHARPGDELTVRLTSFDLAREAEMMQVARELATRRNESVEDQAAGRSTGHHRCVLVVDDRQSVVDLISAQLQPLDVRLHAANGVLPALATLDEHVPSLIILDVMMPGVDGLEVCRLLKRLPETKGIPVAILTGLDREQVELAAGDSGADFLLSKPIDGEDLRALVAHVLRLEPNFAA